MTRGGANYRVKWQSDFLILRAPRALNTENTVSEKIFGVEKTEGKLSR